MNKEQLDIQKVLAAFPVGAMRAIGTVLRQLVAAPSASNTPWDGTGLPPPKTRCELQTLPGHWRECEILMHYEGRAIAMIRLSDGVWICEAVGNTKFFRPLFSAENKQLPESVAADLAGALRAYQHSSPDPLTLAWRLVELGYRKMEQPGDERQ